MDVEKETRLAASFFFLYTRLNRPFLLKTIMTKKLTLEEFIEKARKVHGDFYDYSKSNYIGNHKKLTIICPLHGDFEQTPGNHCQGVRCPKCYGTPKLTIEEFIEKSRIIHENKYSYDKVDYRDAHTKVIITCPKHGDFEQKPNNHLNKHGCWRCYQDFRNEIPAAKSIIEKTSEFVIKAHKVHGNKYDYSKTKFINSNSMIIIICPKHGEFLQKPNIHLEKKGCKLCGIERNSDRQRTSVVEFIKKAKEVHGDKYDYSKVAQKNSIQEKVIITCREHGDFEQRMDSHLQKKGCVNLPTTLKGRGLPSNLKPFPVQVEAYG